MLPQVPIAAYLTLAAVLFSVGVAAFLIKRNLITIFMSIELMLNAVNLTFVAFAHMWHQVYGQIFVFSKPTDYLGLIPLLPFAGFLINGTMGRRLPRALVTAVALICTAIPAV